MEESDAESECRVETATITTTAAVRARAADDRCCCVCVQKLPTKTNNSSDTRFFYDVLGDLGTFFEPISM